jgi:RNA recognition motif-containing protein
MKKLYVGNLPYTVTDGDLRDMFSKVGEVASATIIMDRMSHSPRSKGFGFVEMTNDSEADAAIEKYNGMDMEGRAITVNVARPPEPRENRGGGGDRGGYRGR